jgi:Uma2 family endonuclease
MKDRNNKFFIYELEGIPYYIIVDMDNPDVEIYHLKDDKYFKETFSLSSSFAFNLAKNCTIDILFKNIWE